MNQIEDQNNRTSRMLFIWSFVIVSVYLLSEPIFTLTYSLVTAKYDKSNQPIFISEAGKDICTTLLIVFAATFIAKNNTGLLSKLIEGLKVFKSSSTNMLKTAIKSVKPNKK